MQLRRWSVVAVLGALAALAAACGGGDDGGDGQAVSSGGAAPSTEFTGRAPQATPTKAAAEAEATQASIIQYQGGYGGTTQTEPLTVAEAVESVGKSGQVCGTVMFSDHDPEHSFKITVLNFDKAEDPDFFVYFWDDPLRIGVWPDKADRSIDLTTYFNGRKLCVEGRIELYKGKPSINANYWHQYTFPNE